MYFSGNIGVRPSQETLIEAVKPTQMFGKIFYYLTAGLGTEKEEHETFNALSILQQFNIVFRRTGITNIVRLAKDDFDFYLDEKGVEDDLKEAMDNFEFRVDKLEAEVFKTLYLVMEHETEQLRYLIEIDIKREHKVGEMPIAIHINGIINDLKREGGTDIKQLKKQMSTIFKDQNKYDGYLREKQHAFDQFVQMLEQAIRTNIKVDSIEIKSKAKMIRPKKSIKAPSDLPQHRNAEPVYYGYYGYQDAFLYAWLWSEMSYFHSIHAHNFTLVDEAGQSMLTVGDEGFNASSTDTLNVDAPFEAPESGDIEYHSNHEYQNEFESANLVGDVQAEGVSADESFGDDGRSWLNYGDWDSSGDNSSCSSCSSCSGFD
ncbi:MAG: hypothetical protein HQM13_10780 [SAR324 cluster bacterium]|nr:hypothetical protein [SAR324 cluster bacterium]